MKPLRLVHFSSGYSIETLADCLATVGYGVNVIEGERWLCDEHCEEALLLFTDLRNIPKEKILSELKSPCHPKALCVFCCNSAIWDSDLIDCCSDFMGWPAQERELVMRLRRFYANFRLERNTYVGDDDSIDGFLKLSLVGQAPLFVRELKLIQKIAQCEVPVLIEGETGTGKELAARAIHYLSVRHDYPFIPVNCGALEDSLLENELFGHVRGAYTDAKNMQPGLIAQTEGGTLFLDEVDSLSPKAQVSLLRFLQDKQYRPLGGGKAHEADIRVIAASNQPLAKLVEAGHFRQDLLFRLNVMNITMPSLRERPGDAQLIAEHLMQTYREQYKCYDKYLHPGFLEWIAEYSWPGNVRELENTIHREFLLSDKTVLQTPAPRLPHGFSADKTPDGLSKDLYGSHLSQAKASLVCQFEKHYLSNLLAETKGNVTLAAKIAGKERRAFGKLLKKHGIDRTLYLEGN